MLEPAKDAFDVIVAPGTNIQAAVDSCPRGGSVLLLPGTYEGQLFLFADQEVHVFGRGLATVWWAAGCVLTSWAAKATVDGLIVRLDASGINSASCVSIRGGALRLQGCDVISVALGPSVTIEGGADPTLVSCRCVSARGALIVLPPAHAWGGRRYVFIMYPSC